MPSSVLAGWLAALGMAAAAFAAPDDKVSDGVVRIGLILDMSQSLSYLAGERSTDLGLRNIDRVMAFIVLATTRTGDGYEKLSEMLGEEYTGGVSSISEYRAVLRAAVAELYKKIDAAIRKIEDPDTRLHLRLIRAQLENVS